MNATKAIIALFERNKGSDPMSHWAKRQMSVDEAARAIYELWGCTEPKHMGAAMILSRRKEALKAIADRMETIARWISERDPRAESWMVQQDIVISLAAVAKELVLQIERVE
jgi:hypothetical protein